MNEISFNNQLDSINAIPKEGILVPGIPVDNYLQEADDLYEWAKHHQIPLVGTGLVWDNTVVLLPEYTDACRYAQSIWVKEYKMKKTAVSDWTAKAGEGYQMREDIFEILEFSFRNHPDLLFKLSKIKEGTGHADMVQDLFDLSVLGKSNIDLVTASGTSADVFDRCETLASELSELLAKANGQREGSMAAKIMRDRAYTHLKKLVDTIRVHGKFAFRKDSERLKGYSSEYLRKKWRKQKEKDSSETE